MMNIDAQEQEAREAAHRWLNVGSAGAGVLTAGLTLAGSFGGSPIILGAATVVGLMGAVGRIVFLRETEPPKLEHERQTVSH